MKDSTKKLLLIVLAGVAFGSSIVASRFALQEISPYVLVLLRFGIASIAYAATLIILKKGLPAGKRKYLDIFVVGTTVFGLPLLLFFFSLIYISSGAFSILLALIPLFTAAFAHLALRDEKISKKLLLGLVIGLAGVAFLFATKTSGLTGTEFSTKGPLIALAGVVIAAAGGVYARRRLSGEDPLVISALQTIAAFVVLAAIIFLMGKASIASFSTAGWLAVFYNAIVGSYIAFWLTFILIKKYGATAASLPGYVMPLVAGALGAILLGEIITLPLIAGGVVITVGLVVSTKKI